MKRCLPIVLLTSGLAPLVAAAQAPVNDPVTAPAGGLEEIVVTAQHRSEPLQRVPLAITAISGDTVAEQHIDTFSDVAKLTPGFVSADNYGYIRFSSMRGISNNQFGFADDPSIAMYVDGVYQGRGGTGMQENAFFDVDRVEVIKGPQATLFGRSSIAGALSVVTKQPELNVFSVDAQAGAGTHDVVKAEGSVNIPLSDYFALRVAVDSDNRGPIYRDLDGPGLGAVNVKAGRAILLFDNHEGLKVTVKGGVEHRQQSSFNAQEVGLPNFTFNSNLSGDAAPSDYSINDAVLKIAYAFNEAASITLTSSRRQVKNSSALDYDGTPTVVGGPWYQQTNDWSFQQDAIFLYSDSLFDASLGASYFNEDLTGFVSNWVDHTEAFTGSPAPNLLPNDFSQAFLEEGSMTGHFHGYSAFADGTWKPIEGLRLTGGTRFNSDTKDYTQNIPDPATLAENAGKAFACACYNWGYWTSTPITTGKTWTNTSFRASISYDLSAAVTSYVSFNQGWKAGGIDSFVAVTPTPFPFFYGLNVSPAGGKPNAYDPEHSNSYELGLKGRFVDNRLSTNIALYDYYYRDLQVSVPEAGHTIVQNAGRAEGRGVEAEVRGLPLDALELFTSASYNFTRITSYAQAPDQVGLPLNQAPRWTGSAGGRVKLPVSLPGEYSFGADMTFRTNYRDGNLAAANVAGYSLFNARLMYTTESGKFATTLYGENLANKFTYSVAYPVQPFLNPVAVREVWGNPRIVGVDFRVKFH